MLPISSLLAYFGLLSCSFASQLGGIIGDGAASQILRHIAKYALSEPRFVEVLLQTSDDPGLDSLARFELQNRIRYRNLSIHFHRDEIRIHVDEFHLLTNANFTNLLWPVGINDQQFDVQIHMPRGEVQVLLSESSFFLGHCNISSPSLKGSSVHWLAHLGTSLVTLAFSPALDTAICALLAEHIAQFDHNNVMRFPVDILIPEKAKKFLASKETNLYYRLRHVQVNEDELTVRAEVEWNNPLKNNGGPFPLNYSSFEMEVRGGDMVTVWVQDLLLNEIINQVEWDFEWMNEQIPMTSAVIPPDSRQFLSTLCTQCYFLLNVSAKGVPTIQATNNSLVLEKRDSVNLRVVNPDKNVTSVFVSFVLTINAEIRPSFDNGVLRTLVQLLDTNIEMKDGAFPKHWSLFMQDLMRGMILDMLWPEIKNAIEELSYGKGVIISRSCGIEPSDINMDIYEGSFSLTTRLALQHLELEKCIKELKGSLPNTSKLFNEQTSNL